MNTPRVLALAFALSTIFVVMAPMPGAAQSSTNAAYVSSLLAEAKTRAAELKQDTANMNSFVRSQTSWQTHAAQLDQIKQHVNKLGELVAKMNNAKATAAPWQQQLIDRITPLLTELGTSVTATIKHLSDNRDRLKNPPYPAYASANANYASDISQLISDNVAYAEDKRKAEDLAGQSETTGN